MGNKNKATPRRRSKSEVSSSFLVQHRRVDIKTHRPREEKILLYGEIVISASTFALGRSSVFSFQRFSFQQGKAAVTGEEFWILNVGWGQRILDFEMGIFLDRCYQILL